MKMILLGVSVIALLTVSCKKNDDKKECAREVAKISGVYKIVSVKVYHAANPNGDNFTDDYYEKCEQDNTYEFKADGTLKIKDVGTVCTPESDYEDKWSLNGNTITIEDEPYTIESFDCTTLKVSQTDVFIQGGRLEYEYKKQ